MPGIHETLHGAGLPVFPCYVWRNEEKQRWEKAPAVPVRGESWKDTATRPIDDPALDWSSGVVGVPIPPRVVVLDLDTYKGGTRQQIDEALGVALDWDAALIQRTISGGEHYAFRCEWDVRQLQADDDLHGLDTRAAGRGFICTGEGYTPHGFGLLRMAHPESLPELPDAARAVLERVEREHTTPTSTAETRDDEQAIEALRFIDPGCNRAQWVRIGLALRNHYHDDPEKGRELFVRWSSGEFWPTGAPENYDPERMWEWDTFKAEGNTTAATMFYVAMAGGWRPPASFDTAAAFGGGDVSAFIGLLGEIRENGRDVAQTGAIIDKILAARCDDLQRALLKAELKGELKAAGVRDAAVNKTIDRRLDTPPMLDGSTPSGGNVLDPNTPLHPTQWAPFQTKGKDLKPKATLRNFEIMLAAYGVTVEFDEIRKTLDVKSPSLAAGGVLHEEAALAYLESLANLNDYPTASIRSMIMPIANQHTVNPVQQYADAAQWDGGDHVGLLWGQLTLEEGEDPAFCELLFRKWLRGAYAIGTGALSRWEHVLVLVDPNGGAGKTRFFSTLCPADLRADSVVLDAGNRDSVKMAISYWLVELGELDGTFNRSESAKIKAFLSMERDEMRLPYGRAYMSYPRRTAFFASVNEPHYLTDHSDNRRFWGIRITAANYQHRVNVQQVWAQVAHEVAQGAEIHLNPAESQRLRARNEAFRTGSPIADALATLTVTYDAQAPIKTVTEILAQAGAPRPTRSDINEASRLLRRMGIGETRRGGRAGYSVRLESGCTTAGAFQPVVHEGGKK